MKLNDYYEFPRKLDMEPYTAQGLAKIEGNLNIDNTVFILISAHVPVSAHPGHFRKVCS